MTLFKDQWWGCTIDGQWRASLHWRHNDHDGISNHQPRGCLLNHLFGRRSKKTSKLRVTGLCVGNSLGLENSPHKGPVTWKMCPFDDVIMWQMLSHWVIIQDIYCQISNITCTLVGNKIVDNPDIFGASPVQLHLQYQINTWLQYIVQRQLQDEMRNI